MNQNSNIIINNYKIFKIYFYFQLDGNKEFIFPIESDSLNINTQYGYELIDNIINSLNINTQYGYELIDNIINKINNMSIIINYNLKEFIISLKNSEDNNSKQFYMNNYELRFCNKKTLKPKFDLPPFSSNCLLENIQEERISFICKNNLNIILIEKNEDEKINKKEEKNKVKEKVVDEDDNKEEEDDKEEEDNGQNSDDKKIKIIIKKNNYKYDKNNKFNCKSLCLLI